MAGEQIILHFKGLTSGDVVREVAEALLGVEGVSDVEMDEENCRAIVDLVEGIDVSNDDLLRAVEGAGHAGSVAVTRNSPIGFSPPLQPPL